MTARLSSSWPVGLRAIACAWIGAFLLGVPAFSEDVADVRIGPRNELLVQGKPFLPIFVWVQPMHLFEFHKGLGINTVMGEGAQSGVTAKQFLDAAAKSGMWGIIQFTEANKDLAKHPSLLVWMFGDEPDLPANLPYEKPKAVQEALANTDPAKGPVAIWVEGEGAQHDFPADSWMDRGLAAHRLSGGKWLSCYAEPPLKDFTARWTFTSPAKGTYHLWVREFTKNWASPSWWRVNQNEWKHTPRDLKGLELDRLAKVLSVGWCRYGPVDLDAGEQALEIKVNEVRTAGQPDRTGNDLMLGIDAVLLTTAGSAPNADPQPPAPRRPPDSIREEYRAMKAFDPNRPVFLNLTASFFGPYNKFERSDDLYRAFIASTDIVSYDHYPIYGWGKPEKIVEIAGATAKLVELAEGKKPVWAILECTNGGQYVSDTMRAPTPAEIKAEVMMAVIHGAKGVGYFPHVWKPKYTWCRIPEENQQAMKEINRLLTDLAPVILGSPSDLKVDLQVSAVDPISLTEGTPKPVKWVPAQDIQFTLRRTDAADYLFLVSLVREMLMLKVKLPQAYPTIHSEADQAELARAKDEFSVLLPALGIGVYRLSR